MGRPAADRAEVTVSPATRAGFDRGPAHPQYCEPTTIIHWIVSGNPGRAM
jgi:hypothetical protein